MKSPYSSVGCPLLVAVLLVLGQEDLTAQDTTNYSNTFSVNQNVPEGDPSGLALTTSVTGLDGSIDNLSVSLDITGSFNGDMYAYLRGPNGGFAVLLNRVGVSSSNPVGYADSGFDVTFNDSLDYDNIHDYQSNPAYSVNNYGQLTGTWASDGRNIDPESAPSLFDTTTPTATLQSFFGESPDGDWTLFIADLSSGSQSTVVQWGLDVETAPEPTPEPSAGWLVMVGAGVLLVAHKRRKRSL